MTVLTPIGRIHTCFPEKFGIPRQSGLALEATGSVELFPPYDEDEVVRGLTSFSHIWALYFFHGNPSCRWRPTVRPPRLGGNRRIGVFASRSPFRPNPVGMSALRLEGMERRNGRLLIHVSGVDMLDQTPILDIKPYLPWADSISDAKAGFAPDPPSGDLPVMFSASAAEACDALERANRPGLRRLIVRLLSLDPRPAYRAESSADRVFGMALYDLNIRWVIRPSQIRVLSIDAASAPG